MDEIRRLRRLIWVAGGLLLLELASSSLEAALGESMRMPTQLAALALIALAIDLIARALARLERDVQSLGSGRPPST